VFALEDRWYLKAAGMALAGSLLNPYGAQLHYHVFRYLTDSALLSRIGEFQSFDFHTAGAGQIVATVLLGVIGGTLALTQKRLHHFVLAILITALALRSARALPLCALLLLPIANAAITRWLESVARTHQFLAYSANLRALDVRFHGFALIPLVLLAAAIAEGDPRVRLLARPGNPAAIASSATAVSGRRERRATSSITCR